MFTDVPRNLAELDLFIGSVDAVNQRILSSHAGAPVADSNRHSPTAFFSGNQLGSVHSADAEKVFGKA